MKSWKQTENISIEISGTLKLRDTRYRKRRNENCFAVDPEYMGNDNASNAEKKMIAEWEDKASVNSRIQLPEIHKEYILQAETHKKITEDFGGKMLYMFSKRVGYMKVIKNKEVIAEIREEISVFVDLCLPFLSRQDKFHKKIKKSCS